MAQFDLFDADGNDILGASDYGTFAERLRASGCTRCDLHGGRTNIVIDRGNPAAKLLVIGEGPGADEDAQGKAFVGRAGKMLDDMMRAVGYDTNRDMLICNVVKCRPPGNRAPRKEEAAACIGFLRRQLELVRPKLVVLLGATALKHLAPDKRQVRMGDEVGKLLEFAEYPSMRFMVLYHPAGLLYNARLKPEQRRHLETMRRWLEVEGIRPGAVAGAPG